MPKRIKPKYTSDQMQPLPPFAFEDATIANLLESLPILGGNRGQVIANLTRIARDYLWQRNQRQQAPSRAEQNAVLADIAQRSHDLAARLVCLPMETEWSLRIHPVLQQVCHNGFAELADNLEDIADIARIRLKVDKARTGPQPLAELQRTVDRLALIWKEATGEALTHRATVKTIYDGGPQSRAGRFITAFFATVDPALPATMISTAMASHVRSRRAQSGISPVRRVCASTGA
jgi:hypothetical protein